MKSYKLKALFSVLMAWAICLQATNLLWVFIGFECNRDYIEQNLCINRYGPAATCKGFCYISEKTLEQKDVSDVLVKVKSAEILLFARLDDAVSSECPFSFILKICYPQSRGHQLSQGIFMRIFKPPIV
ncbi:MULTISPECIES: hypothetical protein [Sphingobacterium]|uniref:Uncharacterized protein n=1 Tax=Sphingobacterium athyrii TaxID=2152717 RepID=A0A363NZW0_9SPHI|nr:MULTISPECIES: hypothetical protein [Sphingobacterium]PUV26191.1 hypothetical protein DCO56_04330 [Sphingobacterium athyrii]